MKNDIRILEIYILYKIYQRMEIISITHSPLTLRYRSDSALKRCFAHSISFYSIYFYLGMSPTLSFSPTVLLSTFSSLTFIVCNKSHSRFTRPSPHTCSPRSSPLSHSHLYLFAAKGKKERERAPLLFTSSCFVGASFAQGTIM